MKFPRTVLAIGAIAVAMLAAAPAAVHADLAASPLMHRAAAQGASDIQVAIPRVGGSCAANSLPRMKAAAATVKPSSKKLSAAKPDAAGPIVPAVGPDGLTWLCREDEEAQQCVCIPFVQ